MSETTTAPIAPPAIITVIGLGQMGLPMAARLVLAGFTVHGADPSASARAAFEQGGGKAFEGPAEAAAGASAVITMLPTGKIVRDVLLGTEGIAAGLPKGTLIIDMSSSAPTDTTSLAGDLAPLGLPLLDAPVSGGVKRAIDGSLAIMAGGADAEVERARPVLAAMGKSIFATGPVGSGHAMKALNNYVSAAGLIAASEALLVGRNFGLKPETIVDVLNASTGRNNSTEVKMKPFVITEAFNSGFSFALMAKDLRIAADLATHLGLGIPQIAAVASLWEEAKGKLKPDADHTEIYRYLAEAFDNGAAQGMSGPVSPLARLRERILAVASDPELRRLGAGLRATLRLACDGDRLDLCLDDGAPRLSDGDADTGIVLAAGPDDWSRVLLSPPPPRFQAFTALAIANPAFTLDGDPLLIAQARAVIERLFELVTASPALHAAPVARDLRLITGGYHRVSLAEGACDLFVEQAGSGTPILFLHTAGADARQFHGQLADVALAGSYRMIAADMPFHGRSMPPAGWQGEPYRLNAARYLDWCAAVIEQVIGGKAIVAGGSMGAGMALWLAAERPDLVAGIVAIEPPFQSKGRRNPYQHHVGVHAGLHNAAFVRGLMSPTSPLDQRRRAAWIYSQGAPEIYSGDLAFYSEEFDGAVIGPRIDTQRTPAALLCGTYDYSATPEDGARLAALMPGAMLRVMDGLGHFPMCEHPDLFRPHLLAGLDHVAAGR